MLFTSVTFVFFFLPAFLIAFRLLSGGRKFTTAAKILLISATYIFYGFENTAYLLPFIFTTTLDLLWSYLLKRTTSHATRKLILAASVLQNLSLFFIFKYLNSIASWFPDCAPLTELQKAFADANGIIPLPPGISFYLFESLSFVIDCYRDKIRSPKNPLNFLVFISMFPRFIAGPIVRYADLEDSIFRYRGMRIADGLFIFMIGFCLKMLFADSFAQFVSIFLNHDLDFFRAWLGTLAYTFQLYTDFSAYSLMAIGLGMTIGFPFLDNFHEPYMAQNITEFWRRWHISLSSWLRDYLYIPLGGNRHGEWRTQLNLFLTMLIGGIWHGANLTFLLWGAYHGLILALERWSKRKKLVLNSKFVTFCLVTFGWVIFRSSSVVQAGVTYKAMLGLNGWRWSEGRDLIRGQRATSFLALCGIIWVLILEPKIRKRRLDQPWHILSIDYVNPLTIFLILSAFLLSLAICFSATTIPFLYFQF